MDYEFGLLTRYRLYGLRRSSVSRWSIAEPSLEVVRMAQFAPDISVNDFAGISSRVDLGFERHLQPTRSRGATESLEADPDDLFCSRFCFSSFSV